MKPKQYGPVYDQVSAPQMNLGGPKRDVIRSMMWLVRGPVRLQPNAQLP